MSVVQLLVMRPQPDADATAARLRARGHEALVVPLLRMRPVDCALPSDAPWAGVLVTSANALRALPPQQIAALRDLPLLAVGPHTAEAARTAGFASIEVAEGDAADLARLAAARFRRRARPLLYLAAADRARDLASALAPEDIKVRTAVVYRMVKESALPAAARDALSAGRIGGVLHYSRRSAEAYRACAAAAGLGAAALKPVQYCLSQAVAAAFDGTGAVVRVAARPDEESLLDLIPG